jgi:hypothetical protein
MGRRVELRDMRSLERRSMYSIFKPLDPNERLPRELILEGRRYRFVENGTLGPILGVLCLPILMLGVLLLGYLQVGVLAAFGIAGLTLGVAFLFLLKAR